MNMMKGRTNSKADIVHNYKIKTSGQTDIHKESCMEMQTVDYNKIKTSR